MSGLMHCHRHHPSFLLLANCAPAKVKDVTKHTRQLKLTYRGVAGEEGQGGCLCVHAGLG